MDERDAFGMKRGPHTVEEYHALPEDMRVEYINGNFFTMDAPTRAHQRIVAELHAELRNYIRARGGSCEADVAPFLVNLCDNDTTYVLPDVLVTCDRSKLSDRGCEGAPDFVAEVVSPSSRRMDYIIKTGRYEDAGVREYWIVDPMTRQTMVYRFETGNPAPETHPFDEPVSVGIFDGLAIRVSDLLEE